MKLLIIGDPCSIWIKKYFENVIKDRKDTVYIANIHKTPKEVIEFYVNKMNVTVIDLQESKHKIAIPKLRGFFNIISYIRQINRIGSLDVIHCHGMSISSAYIIMFLHKKARIVLTFWGSDLLRANQKLLKKYYQPLCRADAISMSTKAMTDYFNSVYHDKFASKINIIKFGVSALDSINTIMNDFGKLGCRELYGLKKDEWSIAVGYAKRDEQQQDKVIEQIAKLPDYYQNNIVLFLQLNYGDYSKEYEKKLDVAIKKLKCKVVIIEKYLNDMEISKLRLATDIFINSQTTDALAASLLEYIYSGAYIINPTWLNYSEIDVLDYPQCKYSLFDEIPAIIKKTIDDELFLSLRSGAKHDYQYELHKMMSWRDLAEKWYNLYHSDRY